MIEESRQSISSDQDINVLNSSEVAMPLNLNLGLSQVALSIYMNKISDIHRVESSTAIPRGSHIRKSRERSPPSQYVDTSLVDMSM